MVIQSPFSRSHTTQSGYSNLSQHITSQYPNLISQLAGKTSERPLVKMTILTYPCKTKSVKAWQEVLIQYNHL